MAEHAIPDMIARCPDCGRRLTWRQSPDDELDERYRALLAESLRAVPDRPKDRKRRR